MNSENSISALSILSSNEFWSAISGAVVAAGVAYLLQRQNLKEARSARFREDRERKHSLAHSILFKTIQIASHHSSMMRQFNEWNELRDDDGAQLEQWQVMHPLSVLRREVVYSPDEMSFVLSLKENDTFNQIMMLDERYNAAQNAFEVLNDKRDALVNKLDPAVTEGITVKSDLTEDELRRLRPSMLNVNTLFEDIYALHKTELLSSRRAILLLTNLFNREVGLTTTVSLDKIAEINTESSPAAI